jgi:hypothetical protein
MASEVEAEADDDPEPEHVGEVIEVPDLDEQSAGVVLESSDIPKADTKAKKKKAKKADDDFLSDAKTRFRPLRRLNPGESMAQGEDRVKLLKWVYGLTGINMVDVKRQGMDTPIFYIVDSDGDVVIRTSRTLVTGNDATDSLEIARTVSAALVGTVQRNCDIADARHAREVTLCTYLLGMREFFRWEHDIPYGVAPPREDVGRWISAREALWEEGGCVLIFRRELVRWIPSLRERRRLK